MGGNLAAVDEDALRRLSLLQVETMATPAVPGAPYSWL